MIKGGYYLVPKRLYASIMDHAAPCTQAAWLYLLKEANFADSKNLKRGQLIRSYSQIQQDLSWRMGNTFKQYSPNQVRGAILFLKNHEIITAQRVTRGILITICNYSMIQNFKNYESHSESHWEVNEKSFYINELPQFLKTGSHSESHKKRSESHEKCPTESHSESQRDTNEGSCKNGTLDENIKTGSHSESHKKRSESHEKCPTESHSESHEKCPTIHNIHQTRDIEYNIYKRILPEPENGECDFERDRRIFFQAFPGVKTFQLFDDNADRKDKSLIKQFHLKDSMPVKYTQRLEELNEQGAGVYLCINETNGKARTAKDIVKVRAVFADCDECPIDPVWQYEPSMVVESSPGKYHAYWFTTDTPIDGFAQLQKSIIAKFGSDPKVFDLPRVLRVPGFEHRKSTPFLSRIIHYTGQQFAFDYLTDLFPPVLRKKWSAPKYQTDTPIDGEFKGQYGASEGGRNNHVVARIGGMIKRHLAWSEIEAEAFREGASCNPPLSDVEVKAALRSMRRYA